MEKTLNIGDFVDLQSGVRGRDEIGMLYRAGRERSVDIRSPSEFINGASPTGLQDEPASAGAFRVAYGSDKIQVRDAACGGDDGAGPYQDERHRQACC